MLLCPKPCLMIIWNFVIFCAVLIRQKFLPTQQTSIIRPIADRKVDFFHSFEKCLGIKSIELNSVDEQNYFWLRFLNTVRNQVTLALQVFLIASLYLIFSNRLLQELVIGLCSNLSH